MVHIVRRLAWLLFALALAVAQPRRADAGPTPSTPALHAAEDDDVTVLTPRALPDPPPQVPKLTDDSALAGFVGRPIAAVNIVVDDMRWADVQPPVISVMRAGDRVSGAIVRKAIEEALASGHFADASVTFANDAAGVVATIHVMPRKVIDSVRIDVKGAPIDGDQLLRDADLFIDGEIAARELPRRRALIDALLQRRGFPSPDVTITTRSTDDPLRIVVIVDVNVGAPRRIERRVLYPVRGTPEEAASAERAYEAKKGDRADETALRAADATLETKIRARGFHRAEVTHDLVLHRGIVVLRVRVDFGQRFETRYEGNDSFDRATLDDALDLEEEADRTPNHLVQKIQEFYVKRGFLDAVVSVEVRGTPDDPIHYLVFHVAERARVTVGARAYPCFREEDAKGLREGGPTSASDIGSEIDSYLQEELPGNDLVVPPHARGLDKTIAAPLGQRGTRPTPIELDPDSAYVPETYERAVQHVQELYRAEGFLSAQVGPVQVMRRRCDPRSRPGECKPIPLPPAPDVCTYDAAGIPLPAPPLEPGSTCLSDPGRGVVCEARVFLRIPVKLGPRTSLYDVAFSGTRSIAPEVLARSAELKLGGWVSIAKLEDARRNVEGAYKEEGYAFVDVKYQLEPSPDRTRARVRFMVSEGEQVFVRGIVVRGNSRTNTSAIERRVALEVGKPYRASDVRKTQERVATLGTFSSVTVALDNPYVPQRNKTVIISVVERENQYLSPSIGFSTGEGFRVGGEYSHINLWGNGIQLKTSLVLSYIPTELIIDPTARDNFRSLSAEGRLGMRATAGLSFPEIGLGPLFGAGVDTLYVHALQRDFMLTKGALIPNIFYAPSSTVRLTYFQSLEGNYSRIFQTDTRDDYLEKIGETNPDAARALGTQLNVPDGTTVVVSERVLFSWDRRDNTFNASRGTFLVLGVEHVDGFPVEKSNDILNPTPESHFFKITPTFAGYIPLPRGLRIATQTRVGVNVKLVDTSKTYPDRLFFMGGVDSMRGWALQSMIPQDQIDNIFRDQDVPGVVPDPSNPGQTIPNPNKWTPSRRPVRGGDLMINQRIELRIPIKGPFETVVFGDIGNLWIDASYPFDTGRFPMRAAVGSGLRIQTPLGPIALDYGFNVTRYNYEDIGALNFAIGLF